MSDSELTLRENIVFRNILSFFRACPQQHVSSLCSIEINRFAIWKWLKKELLKIPC